MCRECGAPVGIFLAHGLRWQHFRGDDAMSGNQDIYDLGHPARSPGSSPARTPKKSSQRAPACRRPRGRLATRECRHTGLQLDRLFS